MVSSIIALTMLALGLLLLLWGFQYRRWLLPLISFFVGFTAAAGILIMRSRNGVEVTPSDWAVGMILSAIYALLAFRSKTVGVVMLAGVLGYGLIVYLLLALDIDDSTAVAFGGLMGAATFALYALIYRRKKWLYIALTSAAGSVSVLVGSLLFFEQLSEAGLTSALGAHSLVDNPLFWPTIAVFLALVGYVAQSRTAIRVPQRGRAKIKTSPG